MTEIYRETSYAGGENLKHGFVTVGTTAVRLTDKKSKSDRGVMLRASNSNSGVIFIGGPGVSASANEAAGMPLGPGESLSAPVNDPSDIWLIATDADQGIYYLSL